METPRRKTTSNPEIRVSPPRSHPSPPLQTSDGHSNHFSNDVDLEEEEDDSEDEESEEEAIDDTAQFEVDLEESRLEALNALLTVPETIQSITKLSPLVPPPEETTWFGNDASKLTRKITRIFTNNFNGQFYTWRCVPRERQEKYFVEFAKIHHWDPVFSGLVQQHFESVCKRRMRDMVNTCRKTRVRPRWIKSTLWTQMCTYWDTEAALKKSKTASKARKSDRKGLGEHKHYSGQKSYAQVQQEMEQQLGRPVSLGEVFIKVNTKPDGTMGDRKAQRIAKTYEKKLQAKRSQLEAETSDGTSRPQQLTTEDCDELFLESTITDSRGTPYGIGSLIQTLVNRKRKFYEGASMFQSMQDQLAETQKKLEEQAKRNARREAELLRAKRKVQAVQSDGEIPPSQSDFHGLLVLPSC